MTNSAEISPQVGADFLNLRLTNAVPSSRDGALIHDIMATIDNEISHVDQAINALELELKKLKTNRVALVERRSGYARLVSPLRSMPIEILGEIFLHASADSLSSRLHTSHVCQRWRDASLGCSELWSTIDGRFPKTAPCLREYFRACVHRSRSRPLTLITTLNTVIFRYDVAGVICKSMKTCSWKEFSWTLLGQEHFPSLIRALESTSRDTLQSLTLLAHDDWDFNEQTKQFLHMSSFQRLSRLTISLYGSTNLEFVDAPWSQLTQLCLKIFQSDEAPFLNAIRQCLNLEECSIEISSLISADAERHRPIYLPKLRKLHLLDSEELFASITSVLVTPVLEELAISYLDLIEIEDSVTRNPCIYQYLETNAPTLRRLWICGLSETEISDTIVKLSHLEELTVGGDFEMRDDVFSTLTEVAYDNVPLPKLYALTIICDVDDIARQAFVDLVESRWWSVDNGMPDRNLTCLRYASLQEQHPDSTFPEIDKLREKGLNINVQKENSDIFRPRFYSETL